jgi:nucleoside-diphosphate-sugar epimerase
MKLLITGATGKVGLNFVQRFLNSQVFEGWSVVALCNNRLMDETDRLSVVQGSLADKIVIAQAMKNVTHVLHMAAVKESPDQAIDVAVKGMFLLLEEYRKSATSKQFILLGGDCSVGHIFHNYPEPISEDSPRKGYPGCYPLVKIIEEVMLEQYQFQYGINGCILRSPWIMEKDDFRYAMTFGPEQFGGPLWSDLLPQADIDTYASGKFAPLLLDTDGAPLRRSFIHVDDLVSAILAALDSPKANQQLFNISMNEPVDYEVAAQHLKQNFGYKAKEIPSPYFSNWLDNTKARLQLNWAPEVTLEALIDRAWNYRRDANDPRKIWYPG